MGIEGIHHVTCITGDAPGNVDFYARVLGLRLVKKTVNQDDPTVYHLFYADEQGSPGADITFFEYPGARRGRAGAGMVHTVTWRVASEEALDFWEGRLGAERRADAAVGRPSCASTIRRASVWSWRWCRPRTSRSSPSIPEVPVELALQGFDSVRAFARDPEASRGLLEDALAFTPAGTDGWEARGELRGGLLRVRPPARIRRRRSRRRHRASRGVVVDDGRARSVASSASPRRACTRHR